MKDRLEQQIRSAQEQINKIENWISRQNVIQNKLPRLINVKLVFLVFRRFYVKAVYDDF